MKGKNVNEYPNLAVTDTVKVLIEIYRKAFGANWETVFVNTVRINL